MVRRERTIPKISGKIKRISADNNPYDDGHFTYWINRTVSSLIPYIAPRDYICDTMIEPTRASLYSGQLVLGPFYALMYSETVNNGIISWEINKVVLNSKLTSNNYGMCITQSGHAVTYIVYNSNKLRTISSVNRYVPEKKYLSFMFESTPSYSGSTSKYNYDLHYTQNAIGSAVFTNYQVERIDKVTLLASGNVSGSTACRRRIISPLLFYNYQGSNKLINSNNCIFNFGKYTDSLNEKLTVATNGALTRELRDMKNIGTGEFIMKIQDYENEYLQSYNDPIHIPMNDYIQYISLYLSLSVLESFIPCGVDISQYI